MRLRIKEALLASADRGKEISQRDMAKLLFADVENERTQYNNMLNLTNGTTQRIKPEWVVTICQECNVTADFLFGLE